jgi:hypothetical protein
MPGHGRFHQSRFGMVIMWGLGRLGCNPGREWVREVMEGSVEEGGLVGFMAQHSANLLV